MVLQNDRLTVEFLDIDRTNFGQRFDRSAAIQQIILDGAHLFCQPEQYEAGRRTCHGIGLCGEFVWDEAAEKALPGQPFPKLGVGVLQQRSDGGPYDIWHPYKVLQLFPVFRRKEDGAVVTLQRMSGPSGIRLELYRAYQLRANRIILDTTVINQGTSSVHFFEYQHNFVAIDNLPVGPGYRLQIPFDRTIGEIETSAYRLGTRAPLHSALRREGQSIVWDLPLVQAAFHKVSDRSAIDAHAARFWKLSHEASPASIEEHFDFLPARLVLWGTDHCICTEVYHEIQLRAGEMEQWQRSWICENVRKAPAV